VAHWPWPVMIASSTRSLAAVVVIVAVKTGLVVELSLTKNGQSVNVFGGAHLGAVPMRTRIPWVTGVGTDSDTVLERLVCVGSHVDVTWSFVWSRSIQVVEGLALYVRHRVSCTLIGASVQKAMTRMRTSSTSSWCEKSAFLSPPDPRNTRVPRAIFWTT
jgi:hypothetical protein